MYGVFGWRGLNKRNGHRGLQNISKIKSLGQTFSDEIVDNSIRNLVTSKIAFSVFADNYVRPSTILAL